jgi:uncharacterized protein
MPFEWDPEKARSNWWKHQITFEEAITIFADPNLRFAPDPEHSYGEEREWAIGETEEGAVLVVVFTMREDEIRIISARPATQKEIRRYESGN